MNKYFAKCWQGFDAEYKIGDSTWGGSMELWVLHGIEPGGFLESVMVNDLFSAAAKSHPANKWSTIVELVKWLNFVAPPECYGTVEKMKAWRKLTDEQRMEKCIERGIMPSPWELLSEDKKWTLDAGYDF